MWVVGDTLVATALSPPSNPTVTAYGTSGVNVKFSAVSGAAGYRIKYGIGSPSVEWPSATGSVAATDIVFQGLAAGNTYSVQVATVDSLGNIGAYSSVKVVTLSACTCAVFLPQTVRGEAEDAEDACVCVCVCGTGWTGASDLWELYVGVSMGGVRSDAGAG